MMDLSTLEQYVGHFVHARVNWLVTEYQSNDDCWMDDAKNLYQPGNEDEGAHYVEVANWYIVEPNFAKKLLKLGEVIWETEDGPIWGRIGSSQSVTQDGNIVNAMLQYPWIRTAYKGGHNG